MDASILLVLEALESFGLLRMAFVMCLMNGPSLIFILTYNVRKDKDNDNKYLKKEDFVKIRVEINELTKAMQGVKETMTRHDERFKIQGVQST